MNEYRFEDLFVGMEESFSRQITEEMMQEFLSVTGDTNPLHQDDDYAKTEGYRGKVVYGMLTAALISTWGGIPARKELFDSGSGSEICKARILRGRVNRYGKSD